ncbi:M14 family zinc carboxypeptidase [Paenibacillus oralis]|uniref:M14 family zinc carboxypeptidase n=1 Tax=Paenibacillus oralis TaxID=2490856 RepID=UPI001C49842F
MFVFTEAKPDGKVYSQTNHEMDLFADMQVGNSFWWKKNRRSDEMGKPVGVDLNRNFDFLMGQRYRDLNG